MDANVFCPLQTWPNVAKNGLERIEIELELGAYWMGNNVGRYSAQLN